MKTDTSEPQSVMHGEHDERAPAAHAQDVHDFVMGYFDALSAGDVPRIAGSLYDLCFLAGEAWGKAGWTGSRCE